MYPFRYDMSLRVIHPSMDPRLICNRLGLQASLKQKVGEKRQTPAGTPLSGVYKETFCVFDLTASRGYKLEQHIIRCNKALEPHKRFLSRIASTGGSAEYFIGVYLDSNHGVVLSPEVLAQLSKLRISLSLDLYSELGHKSRRRKRPRKTST